MSVNSRRKAIGKRREAVYKEIIEYLNSEEFRENDPISKRIYELTEGKHGRLEEAMKIACEEFGIK
jgi:hypothetical protein